MPLTPTDLPTVPAPAPRVSIGRLPATGRELFGREAESFSSPTAT
jgi:hypothetical protein